jgi:O-antigen/teichoic acid export membrane protein
VPAWLASSISLALLRGFHLFTAWNALRALNSIGYVAMILAFLVYGIASVSSFITALVMAHGAVVVAARVVLAKNGFPALPERAEFPRALFAYGLKAHTSHVGRFMTTRLDEIVISLMMAPAALGHYVVALTLAKVTRPLVQTVADVALPRTAMAGPTREGLEMFRRYVRLTCVMMVALCLPLMLVGPWLVDAIFGSAYHEATTVVVPVILATLPFAGKTMLASGLKAFDRGIDAGKCELAGMLLMAVAAPAAVVAYGIVGVAWAAVVSQTLSFLMMSRVLNTLFPARWAELYCPQTRDWAFIVDRAAALAATVARTASR